MSKRKRFCLQNRTYTFLDKDNKNRFVNVRIGNVIIRYLHRICIRKIFQSSFPPVRDASALPPIFLLLAFNTMPHTAVPLLRQIAVGLFGARCSNVGLQLLKRRSSLSQAVQLYQRRNFDQAAAWCQLCCFAAEVKNVVMEPANFAKMFELWATILIDGDKKSNLQVAFEAIKKAYLKKPTLSCLYTQLRIALKRKE